MDPAWVGVVGALGGVVVGFVGQWWMAKAAFRREKSWSVREIKKARIEKLWEAIEHVRADYASTYTQVVGMLNAVPKGNVKIKFDSPETPWSHVTMLVALHLPRLKPQLDTLIADARAYALEFGHAAARAWMKHVSEEERKAEADRIRSNVPREVFQAIVHGLENPQSPEDARRDLDEHRERFAAGVKAMQDALVAETRRLESADAVDTASN